MNIHTCATNSLRVAFNFFLYIRFRTLLSLKFPGIEFLIKDDLSPLAP